MFTDSPATPLRLEALIKVLEMKECQNIDKKEFYELFQPRIFTNKTGIVNDTVKAAKELKLLKGDLSLSFRREKTETVKDIILNALDSEVLCKTDVEDYFALFYSHMLGLNKEAYNVNNQHEWLSGFEKQVFPKGFKSEQFNLTKLSGLHRWLSYSGLGFYDEKAQFQPFPVKRIRRGLKKIFGKKKSLESNDFMVNLGKIFLELDGGEIFKRANPSYNPNKQCTLGLSHALIALHNLKEIRLSCTVDSGGWSISLATPVQDKYIRSHRIDSIEILQKD